MTIGHEDAGQFPGRGRLSGAVDPHNEDDGRLVVMSTRPQASIKSWINQCQEFLAQRCPDGYGIPNSVDSQPRAQPIEQLLRRTDPEIRDQQDLFDLVPGLLVERITRQQSE
jgi:hypothetical protein